MLIKVMKWGNSLALRIPHAFAREIRISENDKVNLTLEDGKLSIEPAPDYLSFDLKDLLEEVNEDNVHYEIDSGKPRGKEIW